MYACACVQIKLWHIPDEGLSDNLTDWTAELVGHSKKVNYIEWHPTAADILLSAAADLQVVPLVTILRTVTRPCTFSHGYMPILHCVSKNVQTLKRYSSKL